MATKKVGSKTFDELLEEWDDAVKVEPAPPEGFLPLDVIANRIANSKGISYTAASHIPRTMFNDGQAERLIGPRKFQGKACSHVWYKPR